MSIIGALNLINEFLFSFPMNAVWLKNLDLSYREDVPIPIPGIDEALIKVHLAGICSTDLELLRGYYPYEGILGHEFVGEVIDLQSDDPTSRSWIGKRVVGEINITCGKCKTCLRGNSTHCENRSVLGIINHDGVFAEYVILPLRNLHEVPASVKDEAAVFTEPLAAALEIQDQIHIQPTDFVLIVGAGRLGQLIAQTLALTGCELQVVTRYPHQGKILIDRAIPFIKENEIPQNKVDIVVEATGSPEGFTLALQAVRPRGTIVLKSTYKGDVQLNLSSIVVNEITIIGSRCGPFFPALNLLDTHKVDPIALIQARYPLKECLKAFEQAVTPGTFKVLLYPG